MYYSLQFLAEVVREPQVEGEAAWQVSLKEWDLSSLLKSLTFTILCLKQNKTKQDPPRYRIFDLTTRNDKKLEIRRRVSQRMAFQWEGTVVPCRGNHEYINVTPESL